MDRKALYASDVLSRKHATGTDAEEMARGSHFDYTAQRWCDGHDHAHFADDRSPLVFCGADMASCVGLDQDYRPAGR